MTLWRVALLLSMEEIERMVADAESIRRWRGRVVDLGLDKNTLELSHTRDLRKDLTLRGKTK